MKIFNKILLVLSLLVFTQSLVASEKDELKALFLKKIDTIIAVVKDKELSRDDRNSKIIKNLTPMFDFELMAKLSLGKKIWKSLSKDDREKFVDLYVERMKKSYSSKIDSYKDEKIEVLDVKRKKNRIAIKTDIATKDNSLEVIYKYYKPKKQKPNKDIWLIYDVEIIGISILKADKAQFKEFLQTKNIYALMDELKNLKTNIDAK